MCVIRFSKVASAIPLLASDGFLRECGAVIGKLSGMIRFVALQVFGVKLKFAKNDYVMIDGIDFPFRSRSLRM